MKSRGRELNPHGTPAIKKRKTDPLWVPQRSTQHNIAATTAHDPQPTTQITGRA